MTSGLVVIPKRQLSLNRGRTHIPMSRRDTTGRDSRPAVEPSTAARYTRQPSTAVADTKAPLASVDLDVLLDQYYSQLDFPARNKSLEWNELESTVSSYYSSFLSPIDPDHGELEYYFNKASSYEPTRYHS
ncbi:hypothetical protein HDV03_003382 [Kappamyces sp. JEL0829]|nr:hypothetical protein HDV03_003382 [Kappamyces sp. JEL0829]